MGLFPAPYPTFFSMEMIPKSSGLDGEWTAKVPEAAPGAIFPKNPKPQRLEQLFPKLSINKLRSWNAGGHSRGCLDPGKRDAGSDWDKEGAPDSGAAIPTPKFHPKIPARGFFHRSFKLIPFSCFSQCPRGKQRLGLEFSFPSFCSPCGAGNYSLGNNPIKPKPRGRDPSAHSRVWKLGFGKGAAGAAPSCPGKGMGEQKGEW